jgi:hypothetical protein
MKQCIALAGGSPHAPFAALIVDRSTDTVLAQGLNPAGTDPTQHGAQQGVAAGRFRR